MSLNMAGEQYINAPIEKVWEGLNDVEILKESIPGCQSLEKYSETEMAAVVKLKIGPVSAKFKGEVELSELDPPNSYKISGGGKGGIAGFAKGGADVKLISQDGGTLLTYKANADVGGKMAQLGSRLIDSTAKKLAGQFFEKFGELIEEAPNT